MPSKFSNKLKDMMGIAKAVSYRILDEWSWSKPQPMLNIVEVKKGKEEVFDEFLKRSLAISLTINTPIGLGPYKNEKTRTYIYITQYPSTGAFLKVAMALLVKGVASLRAEAIAKTSWTYCSHEEIKDLNNVKSIFMVGVEGNSSKLAGFLNQNGVPSIATINKIKDVRGHSTSTYLILPDSPEIDKLISQFRKQGGDIISYQSSRMH